MVPEITDEAIEAFVSFTSASRERAIAFLQHNNGDSHRAINAYFENPNDPLPPVSKAAHSSTDGQRTDSGWIGRGNSTKPPLPRFPQPNSSK
ncbi:ubiquitin interaction domain-containing protein [Trichophyton equinum CBS 127.97]|uniref:Ubiquitin interaction domain-containing protein n=1 Tax=Trichophyton equinum (strain ATCC MYA-4606 / CBS 127.97) TaxID=559882 RepID=F2PN33_TRIEC|nr:ubiquitin interaction domain-containing protein [Trichophyton equinum CBS 127.97]